MVKIAETTRKVIIEQLLERAKKQFTAAKAHLVTAFIKQYYSNIPLEDFSARNVDDLYGAVISHWQWLAERKPKERKLRIYNPYFAQHGWQSTHTIVELVGDDMPFLVDSMCMELERLNLTIHLVIHIGGIKIARDAKGDVTQVLAFDDKDSTAMPEAVIHIEVDRQTDSENLQNINDNLARVLEDAEVAVADWQKILAEVYGALRELEEVKEPLDSQEVEEAKAFLRWLANDHFTFLGFRSYQKIGEGEKAALKIIPGSGLGVLRDESTSKATRYYADLPLAVRKLALSKQILLISKTNTRSTVHSPGYTDYIGVKRFDKSGNVIGERRFIGLYTSDAYNDNPRYLPFLRSKIEAVLDKAAFSRQGHASKALCHILETLPRDDLFQAGVDELYDLAIGILHLQERRRVRLFVHKDIYNRYISCLVYIPRDNFNATLLYRIQDILQKAFNAKEITFTTQFSESILARIHYVVRIDAKENIEYDLKQIEKKIIEVGRVWKDSLREQILNHFGEEKGSALAKRYMRAFPAGYRELFNARIAACDIEYIEKLTEANPLAMNFYRPLKTQVEDGWIQLKLFRLHQTVPLSDALPILENMGLRVIKEQSYEIKLKDGLDVWINDFSMIYDDPTLNIEEFTDIFIEVFHKVWTNEVENDRFNRLVLGAHLNWREITILRAYSRYLRQVSFTFTHQYIEEAIFKNANITKLLVQYFVERFNPIDSTKSPQIIADLEEKILKELDNVTNLDEDRIIRRYLDLIKATLRTNYFQKDENGAYKPYLSFKFNCAQIPELPLPLPTYEVFVYSPRFEGVHLRTSKVARGGIRWSDRREDYRTEVLGLVKAQQVKNAIIVPSGAKGGFVPKFLTSDWDREATMREGVACYKDFIRGLLDLADNRVAFKVINPKDTVCYDDHDPYLVVAADKGTATFSDIANGIAKEYDFWLGDAFASGGSLGYDHKKMGITARGGWESVKEHFRQLNIDTEKNDFTVVGIGDMQGDVFGNAMLLSEHIKLIAAFNHQHIFIDPNPDAKASHIERKRLFNLPRSSWEDYDAKLISAGGGVFKRSAKALRLSKEAQKALGIEREVLVPSELIKALLKAPVDLIWNGGIGTFAKASTEEHQDVGDRNNDSIRVNANELRAKAVGEGGNLGFTQLARIEYSLNGGCINTDFIDNSGGVDCSDHEVNLKILLNTLVASGEMSEKERNTVLAEIQKDVAMLVLYNNYRQARAITVAFHQSLAYLNLYAIFLNHYEQQGKINRELEFLPDTKTLAERRADGKGLTRPEIATLSAYSKIILKESIIHSDLPEDAYLNRYIRSAFPKLIREKYNLAMTNHRLRREIIATQLSNAVVTDMGVTFVYQMSNETGANIPAVLRAYAAARKIFDLTGLWIAVESLDNKMSAEMQTAIMIDIVGLIRRAVRWFLRNRQHALDITTLIQDFQGMVTDLCQQLPHLLVGAAREDYKVKVQTLIASKVPDAIATRIATVNYIYAALNIIDAAVMHKLDIKEVAQAYFMLAEKLGLAWFRDKLNSYPVDNQWVVLARSSLKDELDKNQYALTVNLLTNASDEQNIVKRVDAWCENNHALVERWSLALTELRNAATIEFPMLMVALRVLTDFARGAK